jgi:hypothetical protein
MSYVKQIKPISVAATKVVNVFLRRPPPVDWVSTTCMHIIGIGVPARLVDWPSTLLHINGVRFPYCARQSYRSIYN